MIASLIAAIASGEIVPRIRGARAAAIVYVFAALAVICGVGFLMAAAFMVVAARYGSVEAAVGFGIGFLLIAVIVIGIHKLRRRARERRMARLRSEQMKVYAGAASLSLLPALLKSRAGLAGLIGPLLAIAAYTMWKEHQKQQPGDDGPQSS